MLYSTASCMLVVIWGVHFYLERTWPTPFKLWVYTALGVAAILYGICGPWPRITIASLRWRSISPLHALGIVILCLAEGLFLTWVAVDPRH